MLVKNAVRAIMEKTGTGNNALAKKIGKLPQTVSDRLNSEKSTNLSIDKLDEMIRVMGYKIVLVPEDTKVRDDWYEIEDSRNAGSEAE